MAANILLRMLLCCVLLLVSGVSRARDATAVESLLRADYSSVIIDGVRNQLRKHLDPYYYRLHKLKDCCQ